MALGRILNPKIYLTAFLGCLLLVSLFAQHGSASPIGDIKNALSHVVKELSKRFVVRWQYLGPLRGGISPYASVATIQSRLVLPANPQNRFVFWTELAPGQTDEVVYDWARQNNAVAIRDTLPQQFICRLPEAQRGPDDEDWFWNFVDNVSGVYADAMGPGGKSLMNKLVLETILK